MKQFIFPERRIFFAGEKVKFLLRDISPGIKGKAVLRTNLGRGAVKREEIIAQTEEKQPAAGLDWWDIELKRSGDTAEITLGLPEVGVFEGKCCFIPDDGSPIIWADGENFFLKVEEPASVCCNSIYSAFVRQFGKDMTKSISTTPPEAESVLVQNGDIVVPGSGTFRNVIAQLDHIFDTLHCRILQLLPVHPTPVVYGKMGRYGSPFAALDYFDVDPALADFDESATPMEQFGELIDAVHAKRGRIFMDIPVNHTGWASKLQSEHPEYFVREANGRFVSPGAWGVVWADLCRLDYKNPEVHKVMAEVFLFWCRRGIDGFRCDAGYMLPAQAWDYIVAKVRSEYPDTIFMLEGLGGPVAVQEELLGSSGLDWAYSELFQNYNRDDISGYFRYMSDADRRLGTLVSFAETHDNLRLAATSPRFAKLRFLVCGLLALDGGFGFSNGAEFFASEKIDVHGCGALNFGASPNLIELVQKLNYLYSEVPEFFPGAKVELIQQGPGNVLALRRSVGEAKPVLVLINLDCENFQDIYFPKNGIPQKGRDYLNGADIEFADAGDCWRCHVAPGEGYCIFFDSYPAVEKLDWHEPERVVLQRAAAMAQRAIFRKAGFAACADVDAAELLADPISFAAKVRKSFPPPVTVWDCDLHDERREVLLPSGNFLLVKGAKRFRCTITCGDRTLNSAYSLPDKNGGEFALMALADNFEYDVKILQIKVALYAGGGKSMKLVGTLWQLPQRNREDIAFAFSGESCRDQRFFASGNNGAYTLYPADWSTPKTKYEALFAVNPDPRYPVDRRVLFSCFRAWLVVNDFSQEIDGRSLHKFISGCDNRGCWEFLVPAGQGRRIPLKVDIELAKDGSGLKICFLRKSSNSDDQFIRDTMKAELIIRPDLESRINHEITKAYTGAEKRLPSEVDVKANGFSFELLDFTIDRGKFFSEPEWHYMNHLELENHYGQEDCTDRYSPGYFKVDLLGEESATMLVKCSGAKSVFENESLPEIRNLHEISHAVLRKYIVRRDDLYTVIAGYPWFLDWGRDTLIVLRGLIKCGIVDESARIIKAFAKFERGGTIPNMIRGNDDNNRDTSDAPLYLILAVRDYIRQTSDEAFLETDCGGRTLKEVLLSIVENYRSGTANGIYMDKESKLIFSPMHFSWMDTNYPAGTPRQGYPIEIQCLWYAALEFMGMKSLAEQVSASIEKYFFRPDQEFASDCLHAEKGMPASQAVADDHLRPNQLLAITLGAVRNREYQEKILFSSAELLVPGGIRTLADRYVKYPLPIEFNGRALNDPHRPYWGSYRGPEDTSRKPAYHNGTVWCWPFPAYCEALYMLGGEKSREQAMAVLLSAKKYFANGVVGNLPEIADGNAPHHWGGCIAQAWSASEFFRVYEILRKN